MEVATDVPDWVFDWSETVPQRFTWKDCLMSRFYYEISTHCVERSKRYLFLRIIFTTVCTSLLIFTSVNVIKDFLNEPISTSSQFIIDQNINTSFPDVVICSQPMLPRSILGNTDPLKFIKSIKALKSLPSSFNMSFNRQDIDRIVWGWPENSKAESPKVRKEDFIIDCQLTKYEDGKLIDCSPFIYQLPSSNHVRHCQIIRLPTELKRQASVVTEAVSGIRVNLFTPFIFPENFVSSTSGVQVSVRDVEMIRHQQNDVTVSPGTAVSVAIKRKVIKKINRRGSDCQAYTQNPSCQECLPADDSSDCCPQNRHSSPSPPCKDVEFEIEVTRSTFPSGPFLPYFLTKVLSNCTVSDSIKKYIFQRLKALNISTDRELSTAEYRQLCRLFIHLHIYRNSPETEHISQAFTYTASSLISNIGGNMELFLGVSIFSSGSLILRLILGSGSYL